MIHPVYEESVLLRLSFEVNFIWDKHISLIVLSVATKVSFLELTNTLSLTIFTPIISLKLGHPGILLPSCTKIFSYNIKFNFISVRAIQPNNNLAISVKNHQNSTRTIADETSTQITATKTRCKTFAKRMLHASDS